MRERDNSGGDRPTRRNRIAVGLATALLAPGALSACGDIELRSHNQPATVTRHDLTVDQQKDLKEQAVGRVLELFAGYSGDAIENGLGTLEVVTDTQIGTSIDDASGHEVVHHTKDALTVRVYELPKGTEVVFTHTALMYGVDTFRQDIVSVDNADTDPQNREDTFVFVTSEKSALSTDEPLHMKELLAFLNDGKTVLESVGDGHNRSAYPLVMDVDSTETAKQYFDAVSAQIQGE